MECTLTNGSRTHLWFPLSQILYRRSEPADHLGNSKTIIEIPVYLAEEKGVDYEEKE